MSLPTLKTIGPSWPQVPHIKAFTVLAKDEAGNRVTFKGHTEEAIRSREALEAICGKIQWIDQIHGNIIHELPLAQKEEGDGVYTTQPGMPCTVMTADCLSVVFSNATGTRVGAVHAGWRGLESDIIGKMAAQFEGEKEGLLAWIGPGIAQNSYETSEEVFGLFHAQNPNFDQAFRPGNPGKYFADLTLIARMQLLQNGLKEAHISGGGWDTFTDPLMHSARRDAENSGRMLTVIWIEKQP